MRHRILLLALAALLAAFPAAAQVNGTLEADPDVLQGASPGGRALLFSPDPVALGSSISHWDTSASPNKLMEPAINADLAPFALDITPQQMEDIGWPVIKAANGEKNAQFEIWALEGPPSGFFDPRPFAGAPGNPATTLGEARFNLFVAILDAWAGVLDSDVPIDVLVSWQPLFCQGGAATLAAAGTIFINRDHPSFPEPGTWYHSALSEALAGEDLSGSVPEGGGDIIVFMNSDIDEGCLGAGTGYYYGTDGNEASNQVDVAPVVLHEVGHGLGFANFTNEATGSFAFGDVFPGIYDHFTFDETAGKTWVELDQAERVQSARNFRNVSWNGPNVTAAVPGALDPGTPLLTINTPAEIAGQYPIGTAGFGAPFPSAGLTGDIVCLKDGVADATRFNGCTPATNPGSLAGKIALIDRGACAFTAKAANAQAAGAIAAIIANNAGQSAPGLGGADPTITIPVISVGANTGALIRQAACGDVVDYLQGNRFQVTVDWDAHNGQSGSGVAVPLTDRSAYWYFFDPENVELTIKVLNACELDGFNNYWVFASGLTDVEVTLTVTDTQSGLSRQYHNPQGTAFQPIQDTSAFATCP